MSAGRSRAGSWIMLALLVSLLVVAIVVLVVGWGATDAVDPSQQMSGAGYVAMTFGIVATLGLGAGLMALVFYSSRNGHD